MKGILAAGLAGLASGVFAAPAFQQIINEPVCCPYEDGCRYTCETAYRWVPTTEYILPLRTTTTSAVYRYCVTFTDHVTATLGGGIPAATSTVTVTTPAQGGVITVGAVSTITVTVPTNTVSATITAGAVTTTVTSYTFTGGPFGLPTNTPFTPPFGFPPGGWPVTVTTVTSRYVDTVTQFGSTVTVSDPAVTLTLSITARKPDLWQPIVSTLPMVPPGAHRRCRKAKAKRDLDDPAGTSAAIDRLLLSADDCACYDQDEGCHCAPEHEWEDCEPCSCGECDCDCAEGDDDCACDCLPTCDDCDAGCGGDCEHGCCGDECCAAPVVEAAASSQQKRSVARRAPAAGHNDEEDCDDCCCQGCLGPKCTCEEGRKELEAAAGDGVVSNSAASPDEGWCGGCGYKDCDCCCDEPPCEPECEPVDCCPDCGSEDCCCEEPPCEPECAEPCEPECCPDCGSDDCCCEEPPCEPECPPCEEPEACCPEPPCEPPCEEPETCPACECPDCCGSEHGDECQCDGCCSECAAVLSRRSLLAGGGELEQDDYEEEESCGCGRKAKAASAKNTKRKALARRRLAARQDPFLGFPGYAPRPVSISCIVYRYVDQVPFEVITQTVFRTIATQTTATVTVTVPGGGNGGVVTVVTATTVVTAGGATTVVATVPGGGGVVATVTQTVTLPFPTGPGFPGGGGGFPTGMPPGPPQTYTATFVDIETVTVQGAVTVTVAGATTTTQFIPACATIDNQISLLSGGRGILGVQLTGIAGLQWDDLSFTSAANSPYECCAACWRDDGSEYDGVGDLNFCWGSFWRDSSCMILKGPGICLQPRNGAYFVSGTPGPLSLVASNGKCGYLYDDVYLP